MGANHDSRVRVFEGRADVALVDDMGVPLASRRLTENQAVRVVPADQQIRRLTWDDASSYVALNLPTLSNLQLVPGYDELVTSMEPVCYWRFEELHQQEVANEVDGGPALVAFGRAMLEAAGPDNTVVSLMKPAEYEGLAATQLWDEPLNGDFTLTLWVQLAWLQNFCLISAQRFDEEVKGQSLIVQAYSAFKYSGFESTGLHVALRNPPAWAGGSEVYANTPFTPRRWHHVTVVRQENQLKLYLDGGFVGSGEVPTQPPDFKRFIIGRMDQNRQQSYDLARSLAGRLDELAIFNRALNPEEITLLAESGINVPADPQLASAAARN